MNNSSNGADRNQVAVTDPEQRLSLKGRVQTRLMATLDLVQAQQMPIQELRDECMQRVEQLFDEQRTPLTSSEKQQLVGEVMDEVFGLGPLEELMRDPAVSDILVNGASKIYIERMGRLELTDARFRDDQHLMQVIQRIAANIGRRIDESAPMLDARLSDGSRVNAIIPPLALDGPVMSIRRFAATTIDAEAMVGFGSWHPDMCAFLDAAIRCKANVLLSGGTGTGKTTLLNVLSRWIPEEERVVTIEDAAELKLQRAHVVALETRPANIEGKGEVTCRDLLRNTLRMRPDRIIVGEVRGAETVDMLQAMNTGHEGSMSTVHANNPRDALRRLENMVSMAGMNFPVHIIREQIASTLDLLVHLGRLTGGRRKVVSIAEVSGTEGEIILIQDIFRYVQEGVDSDGHAVGYFEACGVRPKILERIHSEGIELPAELFKRRRLT